MTSGPAVAPEIKLSTENWEKNINLKNVFKIYKNISRNATFQGGKAIAPFHSLFSTEKINRKRRKKGLESFKAKHFSKKNGNVFSGLQWQMAQNCKSDLSKLNQLKAVDFNVSHFFRTNSEPFVLIILSAEIVNLWQIWRHFLKIVLHWQIILTGFEKLLLAKILFFAELHW